MEELELSIMYRGPDVSDLQPLLRQFEAKHRCTVRVRQPTWEAAWADLVKVALYGAGPDVSEIGSSWIGNFVAMNGLRPFSAAELASLGGKSAFFPASWQSGMLAGDAQMWAIPWLADTRMIYYRRDLLDKAGVDAQAAFRTLAQFEQTLARLQTSGFAAPWVVPTQHTPNILHNLASWVWSAGGDFISADGKRILFNRAEAHAGIRAHFDLHRYRSPSAHDLGVSQSDALFQLGQAAVTISGPWMIVRSLLQPEILSHTGIALPLGNPFVGGSSLVVWKHTRHEGLALDLVRFLTSREAQSACCQRAGLLPVRLDVLSISPYADQPDYQLMAQGLGAGRSFPSFSMWGLVEDGLIATLAWLWTDLIANPDLDLDAVITERLGPLARRLDLTLA